MAVFDSGKLNLPRVQYSIDIDIAFIQLSGVGRGAAFLATASTPVRPLGAVPRLVALFDRVKLDLVFTLRHARSTCGVATAKS